MQIICISRGTYAGGKELAERLAAKLGYRSVSREDVTDAATRDGIHIGKLEMAVLKHRPLDEAMGIEKERFVAFTSAYLARAALEAGVVYHGRTGHLVLPTVGHVLRIRAIQETEARVARTMDRLGLSRTKARKYVDEVDEDRRRWARILYNVDWESPNHYDIVINFDHVNVDNAASALLSMAALPEFRPTPASERALRELLLAAECRLAIGRDARTRPVSVKVRAEAAKVTVTFPPHAERAAAQIPDVLSGVAGVQDVTCTVAATNILWVQESFDVKGSALPELTEIAEKWNAAVSLVRLIATESGTDIQATDAAPSPSAAGDSDEPNAGILDDQQEAEAQDDGGMDLVMDWLIQHGRAGGSSTVRGSPQHLVQRLDRTAQVSLVVVGDLFLSKPGSVRKRQTRELCAYMAETLRVPVIGTDELKTQYLFGPGQWLKLAGSFGIVALAFAMVFLNQEPVTEFMTREGTHHRIFAVVVLTVFAPLFAHFVGQTAHYLLRLVKFE